MFHLRCFEIWGPTIHKKVNFDVATDRWPTHFSVVGGRSSRISDIVRAW